MVNIFRRQLTYNIFFVVLITILIILWSRFILVSVTQIKGENGLNTNQGRIGLLLGYGWEVDPFPVEEETFTIPEEFDDVYKNYFELQKSWGFDISKFKGKEVTRYSYKVINYPFDVGSDVYANVIVFNDRFVCGEVFSRKLSGFMHSLVRSSLPKNYKKS